MNRVCYNRLSFIIVSKVNATKKVDLALVCVGLVLYYLNYVY